MEDYWISGNLTLAVLQTIKYYLALKEKGCSDS
jgi:hypothetical protein